MAKTKAPDFKKVVDDHAGDIPIMTDKEKDDMILRERNRELKMKFQRLFQVASDARKRYDWTWINYDLFRRGYHFSRYNPSTKTVALSRRSQARIPVNIVHAQMRTIKNQVTSIRPKWEVLPVGLSDEAQTNARYSGKLLDYYYDHLNLRKKIKETIIQGLMYSVGGPWEIGYDPSGGDDGQGEVYIWLMDPFDFYIDPNATCLEDAEYVVKAVRKPLGEIKTNPAYTFYENPMNIKGSDKQAASEYKQFLLQAIKYHQQSGDGQSEEATDILYEGYSKVRVHEGNMERLAKELDANEQDSKDLRIGEVLIRKCVYLDAVMDPVDVDLKRRPDFPFSMLQADVNPMEVYGEGWMKHVIPMNRVLNALESSVYRYHHRYAVGRLVMDKNAGVRIITNEHGDIIEKNAGSEVQALPVQPLPNTYNTQIMNMRQYIEDVGGAHEASMGRIPSGVKSGVGIAELKAADAINQQDLIDGLEDFLVDVARKLLREIANNYDIPHVVRALGKSGSPEHFAVVGANAGKRNKKEVKIGADVFDLAVIGDDNEVRVTIGSWLAHTKDARIEMMKEFVSLGIIDQQTFLENAEFADVQGIIDRTRKDKLMEKFRAQPAAGAGGTQVSDEEIAQQENHMITVEGRPVGPDGVWPQPEDNHYIHLMIHQEALGASGNQELERHMAEHNKLIELGKVPPVQGPMPNAQPPMPGMEQPPMPGMDQMPPEMMAGAPPMGAPMPPGGEQLPPELMAMLQAGQQLPAPGAAMAPPIV